MKRVLPSSPEYKQLQALAEAIAQAKNPQCWFNIQKQIQSGQIDKLLLPVAAVELEQQMAKLLAYP